MIIFSSGTILGSIIYGKFFQILLVISCLPLYLSLLKSRKSLLVLLITVVFFTTVNYINYAESLKDLLFYVVRFCNIYVACIYFYKNKIPVFVIMADIIIAISFYSIFTYLFFDCLHLLPSSLVQLDESIGYYNNYLNFHFHNQSIEVRDLMIERNNSIFWEPGVYQVYINYALMIQIFFRKSSVYFVIILLIISVFTTFSTTGIILSILLFVIKFVLENEKQSLVKKALISLSFPLIIFFNFLIFRLILNEKFMSGDGFSASVRTNDAILQLTLFFERPIFGWGYLNGKAFESVAGYVQYSNSITALLYQQGIFGILIYSVAFLSFLNLVYQKYDFQKSFAVLIFIVFTYIGEPLLYVNFINVFICFGILGIFVNIKIENLFHCYSLGDVERFSMPHC